MKRTLIRNAIIVNEGKKTRGSVVIEGEIIAEILGDDENAIKPCDEVIDAGGYYLLPGVIDEHVHFRDPGLTHEATIGTESRAAVAGGVTSVMDMPNTNPQTTTIEALWEKLELYSNHSFVNYSCYFGATRDNYKLFPELDPRRVCGIKLFMGASTGNMLVDEDDRLLKIFGGTDLLIATHCEEQSIINKNLEKYRDKIINDDLPVKYHPLIRDEKACVESGRKAVTLAKTTNARLHILHVSTAEDLNLFEETAPDNKKITAEVCVPHLLFTSEDHNTLAARIKCNPAIKEEKNRQALRQAVNSGKIDTIATDHAPHLLREKEGGALKAMSGMPMIQFSLVSMLGLADQGIFTVEKVIEKMCHAPADIYRVNNRGYIRKGYQADLVLVKPTKEWTPETDMIYSKCGWSPLEGKKFNWKVDTTFVNGHPVYSNGIFDESYRGHELRLR